MFNAVMTKLSAYFCPRAEEGFEADAAAALRARDINYARGVGGSFTLDDDGRKSLRGMGIGIPFEQAVVVVHDRTAEQAGAYMVGRTTSGDMTVIGIKNLGRLDDLGLTDRFTARRCAHMMRETLKTIGTQVAPERSFN